jgi:hypothetical protein
LGNSKIKEPSMMRMLIPLVLLLGTVITSADAQTQVTVYRDDLTLVSETRRLRIGDQQQELVWPGVAARLEPGSTHLALTQGAALTVLEERFLPQPASPLEILAAYLGQRIEIRVSENEWIEGRLETVRQNTLVLDQTGTQTLIPYGSDTLVRLPEAGLDTPPPPALIWRIRPEGGGQRVLTLSYLTAGLSWSVDYFGEVNATEDRLLLSAKATIRNDSGKDYEEAEVILAAGTVNKGLAPRPPVPMARTMAAENDLQAAPAPQPEAMADLHFYPLETALSLGEGQQVKRPLIAPQSIACKRTYLYRSQRHPERITSAVSFVNDKAGGLDQPLPAGLWRLYRRADQGLRFIGADQRPGTASNEEVTLELGQAFDLSAKRRVLGRRKLSASSEEQRVAITFKNNKRDGEVRIEVEERIGRGDWEITQSSLAPERRDADTVVFAVPVAAQAETTLSYTVVRRW